MCRRFLTVDGVQVSLLSLALELCNQVVLHGGDGVRYASVQVGARRVESVEVFLKLALVQLLVQSIVQVVSLHKVGQLDLDLIVELFQGKLIPDLHLIAERFDGHLKFCLIHELLTNRQVVLLHINLDLC